MIRIFLSALLCSFLYVPVASLGVSQETELSTPVQVVAAFQKLPNYEMFCMNKWESELDVIKIGAKFETYLSRIFYRLFLWSQCQEPEIPPQTDAAHSIYWDIRFGSGYLSTNFKADNIRVLPAKFKSADKAIVKLLFDHGILKNLGTTYTLIREDGQWKIDDIAPKGDFKEGDENYDAVLQSSDSIKTDMQNYYNAAMKRYQQESAMLKSSSK